ncbi:MAG: DUF1272 domain-containing protein [Tunicatimonas sp.]|uniref:DUF1272 domain-containing protein n=1 Tax=Tunicatimonas sp. TaxID=1940096 RepID=UPI003C78234F
MLTIRTNCENCNKDLPYNSTEAMICSYECTFCRKCAEELLKNVCPNCGGGFTPRPIRPKAQLVKYPASDTRVLKPVVTANHQKLLLRYEDILPENR